MTSLARWFSLLPLLALGALACSSDDATPAATTGEGEEVVDISNTKVKDQSIGNCWIYATSAWAESLRMGYSGEEMNISESYLSYVDWFHGIQEGDFDAKEGLQTGGWFGEAAEYLRRYGVMDEGTFIPEEANAEESSRQKQALDAINASIKTGVLSDPANRSNPTVVREELDKAFKLSPEAIALIDESFGRDLSRHGVNATIPKGKGLRAASEVEIGFIKGKTTAENKYISLSDAIGEPSSTYSTYGWKTRKGPYAWNETSYPSSPAAQRQFQIRVQKAMHDRRPVVMTWYVDFNAMDRSTGVFADVPGTPGRQGGHMTVTEDYQISNVPGFGTLKAGVVVTDPAALQAALAPEATIDFFRIKNSWGSAFRPPEDSNLTGGYHDLYMKYLNGDIQECSSKDAQGKCLGGKKRGLTAMVLPPDTWAQVTVAPSEPEPNPPPGNTCEHALCSTGDQLASECDPCVTKVCEADPYCCNTGWDGVCIKEVGSICGQSCTPLASGGDTRQRLARALCG